MPTLVRVRVDVHVPLRSIFIAALGVGIVAAVWQLRSFIVLFVFAAVLAVTLVPIQRWLEAKKVPHLASVLLIAFGVLALGFGLWELIVPAMVHEAAGLKDSLSRAQTQLQQHPTRSQLLPRILQEAQSFAQSAQAKELLKQGAAVGYAALEAVTALIVVLVLALYLLLDGKRLFAWMLSYVPRTHRERVGGTAEEVGQVVRAYVRGQLLTSAAAGVFIWGTLSLLHVPAAVPLGVLAALMDVLPVLGIIGTAVPAALIALSKSPMSALAVIGLVLVYHAIENYLLIPIVYGKQLRLSTLSVLIAFLAGGMLGGVAGAVLMLPLVAAYPIIERRWLTPWLSERTVEEHARMDSESEKTAKEAVDQVASDAHPRDVH